MRTIVTWLLVLLALLAPLASSTMADTPTPALPPRDTVTLADPPDKIAPTLRDTLVAAGPEQMVTVIVTLKAQADLRVPPGLERKERLQRVIELLRNLSERTQEPIRRLLQNKRSEGAVSEVTPLWVFNGLVVTARPALIDELARRSDVLRITPNETFYAPSPTAGEAAAEPNLIAINAPALWERGYRGQGIVVANMDTGVYLNHPDLAAQWRGGAHSWYDPHGEHPDTPTDLNGHGTQTMGVMVGREAGGTAIGVAPEAQWIAVKLFDDRGETTTAKIHAGFQWLLDPDGNPGTADAPHIVNNSWGSTTPGCNFEFQPDLQALRAAGILPIFSAGNAGPGSATSTSPANNPEAFAVGAVFDDGVIYYQSSRGPSVCDGGEAIFPELVAPGVGIHTADLYDAYADATGTSLAAPHVAGALALLLCAFPNLSAGEQAIALLYTAADLGAAGPDNTFGYGRLGVLAAYEAIVAGTLPTSTPTVTPEPPTATATPTPSLTATATPTPSLTATATPTPAPPTPTPSLAPTSTFTPSATPTPVNLALGRPVSVSSYQNTSYNGSKAVDGSLSTTWQTKRLFSNKTSSEWIVVDLGSSLAISRVVLAWNSYYARAYSIQVSNNNTTWTTLFSTTAGDGGTDTISLAPTTARYIKMNSTAWSSSYYRIWLRELSIYGASGPLPTPTSTTMPTEAPTTVPPPTATSAATLLPADTATLAPTQVPTTALTPTPTAGTSLAIHVGDLDGSGKLGLIGWSATVTITVHNASEAPVAGVTVSGAWSNGATGSASGTTDSKGRCRITKSSILGSVSRVTFTVNNVALSGATYQTSANHDPDADSNGTAITIAKP